MMHDKPCLKTCTGKHIWIWDKYPLANVAIVKDYLKCAACGLIDDCEEPDHE